jgi:uncharacterized Zn finger protein (UPF0148 family)
MPLHVGVDALWRTAWASALLVPSVLVLASAPTSEDRALLVVVGLLGLAGALLLLVLAYLARASDAVLAPDALHIEGGAHGGVSLHWHELAHVELRGTRRPDEQDLSLWVRTKQGQELCLAEAARELEKDSVRALHETLLGVLGASGGDAPPRADLARCPQCGAPLSPTDQPSVRCGACGTISPTPAALRERVAAQRQIEATAGSTSEAVGRLLAQPGARRAVVGLLAASAASGAVWATVFASFFSVGYGELGGFEIGSGIFCGLTAAFASFAFARISIARRRALLVLCTGFGARPARAPGEAPGCRECGAPLPTTAGVVARCVYCGAESVLGVNVRPLLERTKRHATNIAALLATQDRERKDWRHLGIGAAVVALLGGGWLVVHAEVAREFVATREQCEDGDAEACFRTGSDYALGVSVAKDEEKAVGYFERACDDDHAEACGDLGLRTHYGWGTERDEAAGRTLLTKSCKLGHEKACEDLEELDEAP